MDRKCGTNRLDVLDQVKRFKSVGVDPRYHCEQYGGPFPTRVKYLTDQELAQYRVVIKDGKFYDSTGQKLITAFPQSWRQPIFIMDRNGAFSSFTGGRDVAGAGEMIIKDGVLQKISRFSGHYKPSDDIFRQVVCELRRRGVEVPESIIETPLSQWDSRKSCSSLEAEAQKNNENLIVTPAPPCGFFEEVVAGWKLLTQGFPFF